MNVQIPQLPPEVWYRILLLTPNPKSLSQTHRNLHTMCLNPLSVSKWIFKQYQRDALLGTLWHWKRSKLWRQWIHNVSSHPALKTLSSSRFQKYSFAKYDQNWFNENEKCSRCDGYGIVDSKDADKLWFMEIESPLTELKEKCHKYASEHYCALEKHQFLVCRNLIEWGCPFKEALPLLLRFAASSGHLRLLKYFISLGSQESEQFNFNEPVFDTMIVHDANHKVVRQLLHDALESSQLCISYQLIKTSVMQGMSQIEWDNLASALLATPMVALTFLFLEENTRTKVDHVVGTIKGGALSFPFTTKLTRQKFGLISMRFVETMSDTQLQEDESLLVLVACESGRVDLIRYFLSKNMTFNHFDNSCLFQAVAFGHYKAVNVLLYECQANSAIYQNGRGLVLGVLIVDHVLLLIAMVTSFAAFVNELTCRQLKLGGPSIMVFGVFNSKGWCIPDNLDDRFATSSFVIWIFFTSLYIFLSRIVSFIPLIRGIYKVNKKIRLDRRVDPIIV
jgi:hypothetical protein